HRLHRLVRRTREDRVANIAGACDERATRVEHRDRTAVIALDEARPDYLGDDVATRIRISTCSCHGRDGISATAPPTSHDPPPASSAAAPAAGHGARSAARTRRA